MDRDKSAESLGKSMLSPPDAGSGVLAGLGAQEAIALDGGHSRAFLAQTQNDYLTDHYFEGGRPVANALLVALRNTNS